MAKAHEKWTVLPHKSIEEISPHVRRVEGNVPGMPLKRVMTLIKRQSGGLVVHNAMALDDTSMKALDRWGPVELLVVPNGYHRLDAKIFKDRYPNAKVVCPAGARKKVEEVVPVDLTYDEFPSDDVVRVETLDGTNRAEGVLVVTEPEGTTLVFNDALFNMPHVSGMQGFVLKHLTSSTGGPKLSRIIRLFIIKDKAAFRGHFERLATLPNLARAIVSHHETITGDVGGVLRQVASTV
ncbi:MAG: hypothetical protein U0271_31610 [Polyangiaceae bacterium]